MERKSLTVTVFEGEDRLSFGEVCRACDVSAEYIIQLVDEGLIEPRGEELGDPFFGRHSRRGKGLCRCAGSFHRE